MRRFLFFPFPLSLLLTVIVTMLSSSCSTDSAPKSKEALFAPCADSPNCVSSDSKDPRHAIPPLQLTPQGRERWPQIQAVVLALPRTRLVSQGPNYLRVECRSAVLRFVDDLELEMRPEEGVVAVRSASRLGYFDFGVNRRRVERLRGLLHGRRLVRQEPRD